MPPRQKITKQMILSAGYELVRENGIEHANSRNIAKILSCSTQPIFSCFSTMEKLKEGIFDYTRRKFINDGIHYVNSQDQHDFINHSIQWYLKLLRNEPNLYKLLYFSNRHGQETGTDFIFKYTSGSLVLSKMQELYALNKAICKDILFRAIALMHGIGALVVFSGFEIQDEEIKDMVDRTIAEMVQAAQKKTVNNA